MASNDRIAPGDRRQWLNRFEIQNREELSLNYRLLKIHGLPPGENYDKNISRLTTAIAYELRQPVALVRRGNLPCLVIPAEAPMPKLEQPLMPHVAVLEPDAELGSLDFGRLDATTAAIAVSFLQFVFRTPLRRNQELWSSGRGYYRKTPLEVAGVESGVDTHPGFVWNVVVQGDGRIFLTVDTLVKYVDHEWLSRRVNGGDPRAYLHRHCVYHFGHDWYMVQLWAITDRSVADQQFTTSNGAVSNVLSYTRDRWRADMPPWIRDLAPESPAIIYRYPGNEQERYGALALCKLALSTAETDAAGLHRQSILDPSPRFRRIEEIVTQYFQQAKLGARPIRVAKSALEVERRTFSVPPLRFGGGRVLAVRSSRSVRVACGFFSIGRPARSTEARSTSSISSSRRPFRDQ
jgi:hypothetical protein